jgi:hypothetical protein
MNLPLSLALVVSDQESELPDDRTPKVEGDVAFVNSCTLVQV